MYYRTGDQIVINIPLKNKGTIDALNVIVSVDIPEGLEIVSMSIPVGTWENNNWKVSLLASGESLNATLTVEVIDVSKLPESVTWSVTSDKIDPIQNNNTSSFLIQGLQLSLIEEKICLNETNFTPTDVNNPTNEEVQAWVEDNLTQEQRDNGTILTYYVGDYEPFQENLQFYFPVFADNSNIDYFTINNNAIIPDPIPIKVDGEYVYDGSFKTIVENWLTTNGFEGEVILDLDNQILILQHVRGGTIEAVYGYSEDGDSYEDTYTSSELAMIPGDGGDCDNPDFTWTLNDSSEITLDYKRTFNTKTVYVDAGSGSDITGKRGYRNFPFKTLNAALAAIQDGDTLHVFPGDYVSSVTVTKLFNIYCEIGVNWDMTVILLPATGLNNSLRLKWKFDKLYSSNASQLQWNNIKGINFIDIEINELQNIQIGLGASESNFKIKKLSQGATIDCNSFHRTDTTVSSPHNSIIIDHLTRINDLTSQTPIRSVNTNFADMNVEINNIHIEGDTGTAGGIITVLFPGIDNGTHKNITAKINNCRYYPTTIYDSTPNPIWQDPRTAWFAGANAVSNQVFWCRQGVTNYTNLNYTLKNYRGTAHGFMMYGYHFDTYSSSPTQQRIVNVKIQGYWEKGIPVSLHWFNNFSECQPENTIINIDLDVICDTSMGVAFWCSTGIHESNRFNISGKIVSKSAGMPCITISSIAPPTTGNIQTNDTITLKDLLLINDGTVPPVMINPTDAQVQNVQIQNVKSNSLIIDTNITEVGESIVRNINYK